MRHRKSGRKLGRNPSHRRALLRNLARGLFCTFNQDEDTEGKAKTPGRIVTTITKAKEARPFVERLITLAKNALPAAAAAEEWGTTAPRNSAAWQEWRRSENWRKWAQARAPFITARRRALSLLGGDRAAVRFLFEQVAGRYQNRPGGYTRIIRSTHRRQGDGGQTAILELVGEHDRRAVRKTRPAVEPAKAETSPAGG